MANFKDLSETASLPIKLGLTCREHLYKAQWKSADIDKGHCHAPLTININVADQSVCHSNPAWVCHIWRFGGVKAPSGSQTRQPLALWFEYVDGSQTLTSRSCDWRPANEAPRWTLKRWYELIVGCWMLKLWVSSQLVWWISNDLITYYSTHRWRLISNG